MIINVTSQTPRLDALREQLGPDGRTEINDAAGASVYGLVARHLRDVAVTRHATARRLGAVPTGHLEAAAKSLQRSADADSATLTINSPGFSRVFNPILIRPVKAKALTIPIHPWAYGKTVYTVSRTHPVFRPGKTRILATTDDKGNLIPLYALVKQVVLQQDRTLLPDDDQLQASANAGIRSLLARIISQAGGAA